MPLSDPVPGTSFAPVPGTSLDPVPGTSLDPVPGTVPPRDPLDVAAVDTYLKAQGVAPAGAPTLWQFTAGASNLTYLLRYADGTDIVLRRPPAGHKAKSAHDMLREADLLTAIRPAFAAVPRILATCADDSLIGEPFVAMERLAGIVPGRDLPKGVSLDVDQAARLGQSFIDRLIDLHGLDVAALGLDRFGKGQGYVARQIAGWSQRFHAAHTDDVPDFQTVMAWLDARQPGGESRICLIHNDYKLDNLVLDAADPSRIVGVLDWEMATLGDPLMELGSSLAYWIEARDPPAFHAFRRQPSHVPGMPDRAELIAAYGRRTGLDVSDITFYLVYGLFRLAVIAQQIYVRYRSGHAANPAFAGFGQAVTHLHDRCRALL